MKGERLTLKGERGRVKGERLTINVERLTINVEGLTVNNHDKSKSPIPNGSCTLYSVLCTLNFTALGHIHVLPRDDI